tara:strand:+ start:1727 stop:2026 length:300 start_codon:yes stop_codon:yes gene_type:complete
MSSNSSLYSIGFIALMTLITILYFLYDVYNMKKELNNLKTDMKETVHDKLLPEHESNNEYIDWMAAWVRIAQQYIRIPGFDWKEGAVDDYDDWKTNRID